MPKKKITPPASPKQEPEQEPNFKHPLGHLMAGTPVMKTLKHR